MINEPGPLPPAGTLAALILLVETGRLSQPAGRTVLAGLSAGEDPLAAAERLDLLQVREAGALADWIDAVLAAHPAEVTRYRSGEAKLLGFLTGQVMKQSRGRADPKAIQPLLIRRLETP